MRPIGDMEEWQWLGAETQVAPYQNGRPKRAIPDRLVAGGMLFLAGIGLGSLGAFGISNRADQTRQVKGSKTVAHVSSEGGALMEQERRAERSACEEGIAMEIGTVLAAFGLGVVAGAVATLLTTPESGASVRYRLKRGVETAKRELGEVVGEAKEDWNSVGSDMRDAVKRTASRVKEAAAVTKESLRKNDTTVGSEP